MTREPDGPPPPQTPREAGKDTIDAPHEANLGPPKADMERVFQVWRRLSRAFPTSSLLVTPTFSRSAWAYFGNDLISGLLQSKDQQKAHDLMASLNGPDLKVLHQLALMNVRRGEYSFRFIALAFVTGPIAVFLALNEIAPQMVTTLWEMRGASFLIVLLIYSAFVTVFFAGLWRMRQLSHFVEYETILRGLSPLDDTPTEDEELDASPPQS